MSSFIGKLLSSTLLWFCLVFNFTQFINVQNLSILKLALSGVKELSDLSIERKPIDLYVIYAKTNITFTSTRRHKSQRTRRKTVKRGKEFIILYLKILQ